MGTHAHPLQSIGSLLSLSDLDKSECAVLDIFRNFLLSYTNNEHPHWELALTLSDNHFGENYGPQAAISVLNVLRAVRMSRKSCFQFNNPNCAGCRMKLTDCERHLLRTLRFARTGNMAKSRMQALILCEGFDVELLLKAIIRLANMLPGMERTIPTQVNF